MVRELGPFIMDWLERLLNRLAGLLDWMELRQEQKPASFRWLLLWVLPWLLLFTLFFLLVLLHDKLKGLKRMQLKELSTFKTHSKGEYWVVALGWFIPRRYRHVIGDILEDCAEMRQIGCTERRIKFHVVYQWLIAVITLVPTAVKTSVIDAVKQVISPPK